MGQAMGSVFGQPGQDPTMGQTIAKSALQGGLGGLNKGLQQPGGVPKSMAAPIQVPQAPMVDPSMFGMGKPKNPFFGG